mmetsp:Transcript_3516/g.11890  ORF Transcript_3516/g.11890 Transcript_3516/m.11890 type:complete len:203 (+) Transcript_3516:2423-3031(+)
MKTSISERAMREKNIEKSTSFKTHATLKSKCKPRAMGQRCALRLALQLYHYIIYIGTSFGGILGGITIFQVLRMVPARLHRPVAICINNIISGCSRNFVRKSHPREIPIVHSSLYATFIISIKSLLLLFDHKFFSFFEKCIFLVTKLRHIVQKKDHLQPLQTILHRIGPFVSILVRSSARTHTPLKKLLWFEQNCYGLNTQF